MDQRGQILADATRFTMSRIVKSVRHPVPKKFQIALSIFGFSNVVLVERKTMQYLLLIYENEKRFSQGYDQGEMEQYDAFGKEFSTVIKGSNALQPTAMAKTVRLRNGKPAVGGRTQQLSALREPPG